MPYKIDDRSAFLFFFFVSPFLMFFVIGFDVVFIFETLEISISPKENAHF